MRFGCLKKYNGKMGKVNRGIEILRGREFFVEFNLMGNERFIFLRV